MPATLSAEFSKIFPDVPLFVLWLLHGLTQISHRGRCIRYHAYGLTETTGVVTAVCGE